ncbi:TIGR02594 family protein [Burkholderia vietnamiensis]|uniref:TIGR02594 family protein n=1 Tax=Burkholderia vietnamiensis TaxID=60552 RepID=UPI000756E49C|nr:TIGR02594 family protein [Burkholderia vietnamiensis]KVE72054.1 peptidoglycan-binding protein LysM [Burkholderia vietnamiensis]
MIKFISATHDKATLTVQYVADNGDILLRSGGTIAWRFNNPGNLRPPPGHKKNPNAGVVKTHIGIGDSKSGEFFIFPDYETGRKEKKALLRRKYNGMSISDAMYIYAPPKENDTEKYIAAICDGTGFDRTRKLESMNDAELDSMMKTMEEHEGYNARIKSRHEQWIRTAAVTFSDGARPIPDLKVVVQSDGKTLSTKTDRTGQLPLLPFEVAGEQFKLFIERSEELKEIGTIVTQAKSSAYVFFHDLFTVSASTGAHFAKNPVRHDKPVGFRYKIVSHDTLGKIAGKFKVSVEQLQKDNHLRSTRIFAGDYLYINMAKPADDHALRSSGHSNLSARPAYEDGSKSQADDTAGNAGGQKVDLRQIAKPAPGTAAMNGAADRPNADNPATAHAESAAAAPVTGSDASAASSPAATANKTGKADASLDRSKQGQGHPIATLHTDSGEAPWMTYALEQAKVWHGQKEAVITQTINYHEEVGVHLKSLVGDGNPWCASFANWCLQRAGYPMTAAPADSQSFRHSKNFVKIDKPVFGAVAVYKHPKGGHAAFVYAQTSAGAPILLGGNQSDAINFGMQKASELKGFFVPASYLKFAQDRLAKGIELEKTTPHDLNNEFHITFSHKKKNADR